jgi:hypothetical protein
MMTSASGRALIIISAVSRMRRRIVGSRRGMAVSPMMASSSIGNGLVIPLAAMALPPTPKRCTLLSALRSARAKAAPSASPDSSAATIAIVGDCDERCSAAVIVERARARRR